MTRVGTHTSSNAGCWWTMSDGEDVRGPWPEAVDAAAEDLRDMDEAEELDRVDHHLRSYEISHANHRVNRAGGNLNLDSEEPHAEASVTLSVDHERLNDMPPVSLHVKTTDKGLNEGLTVADMTVEELEDLHERMGEALEAAKDGARYYER